MLYKQRLLLSLFHFEFITTLSLSAMSVFTAGRNSDIHILTTLVHLPKGLPLNQIENVHGVS